MKYAAEVIDLLAAYPGREFRMAEIVRHVARGRELSGRERNSVRQAVGRVLVTLEESGHANRTVLAQKSYMYIWGGTELSCGA